MCIGYSFTLHKQLKTASAVSRIINSLDYPYNSILNNLINFLKSLGAIQ